MRKQVISLRLVAYIKGIALMRKQVISLRLVTYYEKPGTSWPGF